MSVDLRTERRGGTWTRRLGDHEAAGFEVSVNDQSAHVTLAAHGIMFVVDRRDVPTAWGKEIDVVQLRSELLATLVRQMSIEVLEELFREIHEQRQRAFWDGVQSIQTKIKEALGL